MRRFISLLLLTLLCFSGTTFSQTDNGCGLKFTGKARKPVKMRPPNRPYPKFKDGEAITVKEFLTELCPDASTKVQDPVPSTTVMIVERQTVTIKAFVLAMKRDPDNDLHIQIGDKATPYNQAQIVVEIPPTDAYCDVRTKMMDLFRADGGTGLTKGHVFNDPPKVEFTGYLFLDSHHGSTCTSSGGRGIKNGLKSSPVKSTWEIHPVISLEVAN